MKIKLYKGDCLTSCAVKKAYDKAVKEASIAYKDGDKHLKATLERIFPELKESEDELSWLIRYIEEEVDSLSMDIRDDEDHIKLKNFKKSLAWLENQGEKDKLIKELGQYKVKYIQETLEKYVNSMSNKDDERLRKTTIAFLKDFAKQGYENAVECIDWLEKQGEKPQGKYASEAINEEKVDNQNCVESADKNEPKFKVGDWIVFNGLTLYIKEIVKGFYRTISKGDDIPNSYDWDIDNVARLWTIRDAKDGDVLYSPSHHLIWIYKDNKHYYACVNMNYGTKNACTDGLISIPNDACPATKDEQAILFAKMKEAGCEYVAEQTIKDNGYLTKNNLQESFNEVINRAEARGHINMDDAQES